MTAVQIFISSDNDIYEFYDSFYLFKYYHLFHFTLYYVLIYLFTFLFTYLIGYILIIIVFFLGGGYVCFAVLTNSTKGNTTHALAWYTSHHTVRI